MDYEDLRISGTWLATCPADIVWLIAKYVQPHVKYSHTMRATGLIPGTDNKQVKSNGHLVTAAPNYGLIIRRPYKKMVVVRDTVEPYTKLDHIKNLDIDFHGNLYVYHLGTKSQIHIGVNGKALFERNMDEVELAAERVCSQLSTKSGYVYIIDYNFAWCNTKDRRRVVYNYKTDQIICHFSIDCKYIRKVGKYIIIGENDVLGNTFTIRVVNMQGIVLMDETFKKTPGASDSLNMFATPDTEELLVVYPTNDRRDDHKYIIHVFNFGELVYA